MIVPKTANQLSTCSKTVDWDNWTFDCFEYINDDTAFSPIQRKQYFHQYAWEIFDKVFDFSLAASSESMENLLRTVSLIASNSSPRELYMMVVEKMSSCGCAMEPITLTVLCYAVQIALLEISSQAFIRDGLAVVMKCVTDVASFAAESDTTSKLSSIIAIGLEFCEGYACSSKQWGDNGAVINDAVSSTADSFTAFKNHMIVWFLLALCAECIVHEKNILERSRAVERVVSIITGHTQVSVETVLKHPYRARYFLFTSLSDRRHWRASPTPPSTATTMRIDELLMTYLFRRFPCGQSTRGSSRGAGKQSGISGYRDKGCVCLEELVPWEMVTDEAVAALIASGTACDQLDEESDDVTSSSLRLVARRRDDLRVTRRMSHCGLDVDVDVAGPQGARQGEGTHRVWSILGAAMVAERVLTSRRTITGGQSELYMSPAVFSTPHLWATFHPMLFSLLRAPALAAVEGLRLASSLGTVMQALAEPELSCSSGTQIYSLFLPVSACTMERDESDTYTAGTVNPIDNLRERKSPSVSNASICCVLRALASGRCTEATASPTLASHLGSLAEAEGHKDSGPCLAKVDGSSSPLHDSHLLAGVGAAYSADALTLTQALISAMASSGDDKLRKSSLSSLRSFLRLFDPVSLLTLLTRLLRDCPFPQLRGILLDFIKSTSQCQCHLMRLPEEDDVAVEAPAVAQPHTPHVKSDTTTRLQEKVVHMPPLSGAPSSGGGVDVQDNELAPFQWKGPSSSIFFSALALKVFCIPAIGRVRSASTQQVLDAVDETGAAVNLLIHLVIKVTSTIEASVSSEPHTYQLASFLGWDVIRLSKTNIRTDAAAAAQHLLHKEVKPLVEDVLGIMRGKVAKLEQKIMAAEEDYRPRIPWAQRVPLDQRGELTEGTSQISDAPLPLRRFDLLQLEVLLDNLEFLRRVLQ